MLNLQLEGFVRVDGRIISISILKNSCLCEELDGLGSEYGLLETFCKLDIEPPSFINNTVTYLK